VGYVIGAATFSDAEAEENARGAAVMVGCEIEIRHIGDGPDLVNLCTTAT
jgi:hypothetical protein